MLRDLTSILLFLVLGQFCLGQSALDQRLEFSIHEESIPTGLKKLSKASGTDIAYSKGFFEPGKSISIDSQTAPVGDFLKEILRGTGATFKMVGDRIVVFRDKATLSGYVVEGETGEALIAATVYCPELQQGTITNEYGYYSLDLPVGEWEVQYRYLGFQTVNGVYDLRESENRKVSLYPGLAMEPVLITSENEDDLLATIAPSRSVDISQEMVAAAPSLGGEEDYLRTAQLLPGVQPGVDGAAGLHIRGGDPGHNLMLLDGVPVYIPFHLLGIYSIYNSSIVKSAKLVKGRYSARYGGRLASVFDVRTREGSREGFRGSASVNLINGRVNLEAPFAKKRAGILVSGRMAPAAALLRPLFDRTYFQNPGGSFETKFNDIFGKLNLDLSDKNRIYLSFFRTFDEFGKEWQVNQGNLTGESETEMYWNNTTAAMRWNHLFNDKLFANTTFTYSRYSYKFKSYDEFLGTDTAGQNELYFIDNSSINQDLGLRTDMDWFASPHHTLRFGGGAALRQFNPNLTYFDQNSPELDSLTNVDVNTLDNLIETLERQVIDAHVYLEDHWKVSSKLGMDLGIRGSIFSHDGNSFFRPEPRVALDLQATPRLTFYTSGSRMIQYMHLVSNTALRFPNDLWIPSTSELNPQDSWQGEVGLRWKVTEKLLFSLETYYRKMENLYAVPAGYSFLDSFNLETPTTFLTQGSGRSYGAEGQLNYHGNTNRGIFSYTIARTDRQFNGENQDLPFPQDFDRRHQIKLFFNQGLGSAFEMGLSFQYMSGSPRLDLVNIERGLGLTNTVLHPPGEKNRIRSNPYHRLDLNFTYTLEHDRWKHRFKVGAFNLYNRKNVSYYRNSPGGSGGAEPVFSIPFTFSASYTLSFDQ